VADELLLSVLIELVFEERPAVVLVEELLERHPILLSFVDDKVLKFIILSYHVVEFRLLDLTMDLHVLVLQVVLWSEGFA